MRKPAYKHTLNLERDKLTHEQRDHQTEKGSIHNQHELIRPIPRKIKENRRTNPKLACEALISAYAYTYDFKAIIIRLANIIGPRSKHGVIHDFIQKLNKNPTQLEILGDGTQNKSYLYITDCIKAMLLTLEKSTEQVDVFNVGSEDQVTVTEIAQTITHEMGLTSVEFKLTGGVDGGRGWKGDVKNMLLDIDKIKALGWKPKHNSQQAIKKTVRTFTRKRFKRLI